jgi:hypothetical protein
MSDAISGLAGGAGLPNVGSAAKQLQHTQGRGQFDNVLDEVGRAGAQQTDAPAAPEPPTAPREAERLRDELQQNYERITPPDSPADGTRLNELQFDLFKTTTTKMSLMREAISGVGHTPKGADLRGRLSQVENEWKSLEAMWYSDKDLTPGELLGLQARLYQVSQHVEVLSKVVDQVTGGIKTILNTNV